MGGEGPAIVLVHGITSSSDTWESVAPRLAERFTVVAPDLLGHGRSAKPRGDYSMGAFASGVRDLLLAIGIERATIVGHSLGGGIAMQFSYQFPERSERLVLVSSGGLGRTVHLLLRAATLPGSELVLPLLTSGRVLAAGRRAGGLLDRLGLRLPTDLMEIARGHASLADPEARDAFIHTLRASIGATGQRVDARDRLYLAAQLPTLLIWGRHDSIIPVGHGLRAAELIPGSRIEVIENGGHFVHVDAPERFVTLLEEFIDSTSPASTDPARLAAALVSSASELD
jgi:pimeloyl-ACP methyl ester carboxylesterase